MSVIDFTKYKQKQSSIDERPFSAELVKEYKETVMLTLAYKDQLTCEDWEHVFRMMLNFNAILMKELEKRL